MRYVLIAHRRQFPGGVFAGVSMTVRTVGDDRGAFVGQQLGCEFLNAFGRDVQGSGNVCLAVAVGRERLNQSDSFFALAFPFELFGRNCAFHRDHPQVRQIGWQQCRKHASSVSSSVLKDHAGLSNAFVPLKQTPQAQTVTFLFDLTEPVALWDSER